MNARTLSRLFAAAALATLATAAPGQHFRTPPPVEPAPDLALGEPVALLDEPTTSFGAAALDGWLYVLGGYTGTPHDYNRPDQSRAFYRLNLLDPSHAQRLPGDEPVQSATLEAHDGRVVRVGGLAVLNDAGEAQRLKSLETVASFDPSAGAWSPMPALPAARSSHDTAVVGDTLYVVGGWTVDDGADVRVWRDDVYALDLADPGAQWRTIEAPFRRRALAAVALDGRLVAIGGMTSDFAWSQRVDVYDPETGEWARGPEFPAGAFGVGATVVGDRVVASGASGEVFEWSIGEPEWRRVGALAFPRFFHQLATTPAGDVLALGGISRGVRPRHVERLRLDAPAGEPTVTEFVVPNSGEAKNRQGLAPHGTDLYAFGGNNSVGQHDFEPANFLDEAWRLDLARLEWAPIADYPARRQSMRALTTEGDRLVALGGFGHDGDAAVTHEQGYAFDIETGEWSDEAAPDLPRSRSQFGLVEHAGRLWVFGGLDYDPRRPEGERFAHLTSVLTQASEGGASPFVDAKAPMPRPRRAFGGAALDGRYYLVGGMREDFRIVEACDAFDFESRAWSTIASPQRARLNPEMVALGGRLFLAGGSSPRAEGDGLEPNASLEMYEPETDRWTTVLDEIPLNPRHVRMFAWRGRLLLYSVHDADADAARIALIDVSTALDAPPATESVAGASD